MLNMAHTFTVKSINNFINVVQKSFGVTIPWHLAFALDESSSLPPCKSPSMASICSKCCKYINYYLGEATEAADAVSDQTRITKYETRRPDLDPVPTKGGKSDCIKLAIKFFFQTILLFSKSCVLLTP